MENKNILVVDLDGTLVKTDMFFETAWSVLSNDFKAAFRAIKYIFSGRASLKQHLAAHAQVDPAHLPYNQTVLEFIRDWREADGRVALVTASDRVVAEAIAGHIGLFDEVHASHGERNLKGPIKAEFLVERFGAGNFDYMGDARADLAVWKEAERAITVNAPASLKRAVEAISTNTAHLGSQNINWKSYAKALRPHQWLKNILIFLPIIAAHDTSSDSLLATLVAFISFSLVASSVYVLNDLLDLSADRVHPRKCNRPLASGDIPLSHGSFMAPGLLILGLLTSLAVGRVEFIGIILAYYVLTTAYSLTLKRRLVIDICTLAGLYTFRVLAGGAAAGLPLSVWMLAFSIFVFLSLAAVKRQAELVDGMASGRENISGRAYRVEDLPVVATMAIASGYISVLVMALYINSPAVQNQYGYPQLLWGVCPILLYWISRMVMIAHRGWMDDDPIIFAARDRVSRICGLLIAGIVISASLL